LEWRCHESRHSTDRRKVHRRTRARPIKIYEVNQRCAAINEVSRNPRRLICWRANASCGAWPEDNARPSTV
jgi:hypothetical protein